MIPVFSDFTNETNFVKENKKYLRSTQTQPQINEIRYARAQLSIEWTTSYKICSIVQWVKGRLSGYRRMRKKTRLMILFQVLI